MHAMKRIFRYLKGHPTLGLWYPKDSTLELIAYLDSDYACTSLDRKSTTGGCQFLVSRLISWQCKKQTIVANSITVAEYIAASSCRRQVLWPQNQLLDYGYNFMQIKIYVDNESAIYVVKNPVYHSKTKHIKIRHHFIRDSYEKRLIKVRHHSKYKYRGIELKGYFLNDGYADLVQHAVDGKAVVISESLVRGDLLFDDDDGGYTLGSDEGRITLAELMKTCTILSNRVTQSKTELSTTKASYNKAFITLTNRVRKFESQLKQKRSKAETVEHSRGDDDETLAKTLLNIKWSLAKDKGKGIMQETELPKKLKKKEMIQLSLDEKLAQKFYVEELAKEEARQEQERYNLEKSLKFQRQLDQRKENVPKGDQAKDIDCNDP
nr:putative ribonuclease H-like domain-containing protein [Tanacetum cinerariifolium]